MKKSTIKNIFTVFYIAIISCGNRVQKDTYENKTTFSTTSDTVNLISYGAKGLGVSSLKEDTTALHNAISYLNKKKGGVLYIPSPPKFYAFAGDGIFVGDNIEIYGDGKGKSEIRNVSPLSGKFLRGPIFLFSTYGAIDKTSVFQSGIGHYPVKPARSGESVLYLTDKNHAQKLYVGEVVGLGSGKFNHSEAKERSRYRNFELNEITSIKDNIVSFKFPFTVELLYYKEVNEYPVIVNINNSQSNNSQLGIKNGTSKNIYIHDMSFSQAETDEITNTPLTNELKYGLSGIWQPGGAFNSTFKNLYVDSYGGLDGNMFNRCNFSNIELVAEKKFIDFGYGAANDTIHDIIFRFQNSEASDFASSFIIINDGTHNINMYNVEASGDWDGENFILLSQAKGITMHDINISFPKYRKDNQAIQISDKDDGTSRDINLYNIKITANTVGKFLRIKGNETNVDPNSNINISNAVFKGNIANAEDIASFKHDNNFKKQTKQAEKVESFKKLEKQTNSLWGISIEKINGLSLKNISLESGDILLSNCNDCNIEKIVAPLSIFTVEGTRKNTNFNNLKVKKTIQ